MIITIQSRCYLIITKDERLLSPHSDLSSIFGQGGIGEQHSSSHSDGLHNTLQLFMMIDLYISHLLHGFLIQWEYDEVDVSTGSESTRAVG